MNLNHIKAPLRALCVIGGCVLLMGSSTYFLSSLSSRHWQLIHKDDFAHALNASPVVFRDNDDGWVLTSTQLFKLNDQGKTWTPVFDNKDGQRGFYSLTFTGTDVGYIVGTQNRANGNGVLILQTSDGGQSWKESPTDFEANPATRNAPSLYSITFCGGESGWAVGDGVIMHTDNGGHSWLTQQSTITDDDRLFSVACYTPDQAMAVGAGGLLLRTEDKGKTWLRQDAGTKDNLMQVRVFDETVWIVGGGPGKSVLLKSEDKGMTWHPQRIDVAAALFDISFKGKQGWIAGEKGTILHTNDGGETWTPQKTPTAENITSLFFLSDSNGWAGGDRGTLLRFSDAH